MLAKILGYSCLLCLALLLGIGVYEVYMTAGIVWALVAAVLILGLAAYLAAVADPSFG